MFYGPGILPDLGLLGAICAIPPEVPALMTALRPTASTPQPHT